MTTSVEHYIAEQINSANLQWEETEYNNYQLTHYQCHYNASNHGVTVEEVCVNQYGSMYGIGLFTIIDLPAEIPAPDWGFGWTLLPAEEVSDTTSKNTMNKIEEMAYELLLEKVKHQNQRVYLFGDDWNDFDFVFAWDGDLRAFSNQTGNPVTLNADLKFKLENCFHAARPTIPVHAVLSLSHDLGTGEYKNKLLKIAGYATAIDLLDSGIDSVDNPDFTDEITVEFKLGNSNYAATWAGLDKCPKIS